MLKTEAKEMEVIFDIYILIIMSWCNFEYCLVKLSEVDESQELPFTVVIGNCW